MAYKAKNLKKPINIAQGIAEYALLSPKDYFKTGGIKAPVAPFNAIEDSITVKEQHEFETGLGFIYFALAPGKNSLKNNTVGDVGLRKVNQEVTIFVAGSYAVAHATMASLLNVPLVMLVKDSNCDANMFYQLGCDCTFSYIGWEFTTGTTVDGVKGHAVTITYDGPVQIFQAPGEIVMLPEVVAGAPVITSQPVGYAVTAGQPLSLAIAASGVANTFQWKKAGVNIAGATSNIYTKPVSASGDAGSYTCVVTNANGNVTSDPAVVTVV